LNPFAIERVFRWRGERCTATVVPSTRHGTAAGRIPAVEEARWLLETADRKTYLGPIYLSGEENPPGWSGAVAKFAGTLDREVETI
jgi:hypothetical protein